LPKIEKSQRLEEIKLYFQQEVNQLYQLQHPCIPRFWATFMEERELFIVQEFIPGFSGRQLLLSRRQRRQTFSETEVYSLLTALLSCLDLLHQHHLCQGTIAPDAIVFKVLPAPDRRSMPNGDAALPSAQDLIDITQTQPLLVTFGSLPAGLLRRLSATEQSATDLDIRYLRQALFPIGRMGFMPPEQVHAIDVPPHGDLYALAATCLVLLTGQDPEHLFNQATLSWHWPRESISPALAMVLERMLAWKPVDRYQSAAAVLVDLNQYAFGVAKLSGIPTIPESPPLPATDHGSSTPVPLVPAPPPSPEVNLLTPRKAERTVPQAFSPLPETTPPPLSTAFGHPPGDLPDATVTLIYEPVPSHKRGPRSPWQSVQAFAQRFSVGNATQTLPRRWQRYLRPALILGLGLMGVVSLLGTSYHFLRSRFPVGNATRMQPTVVARPELAPDGSSSPPAVPISPPINPIAPLAPNAPPFSPTQPSTLRVPPAEPMDGELARSLRFAPGEVSTLVRGNLEQAASQRYVLEALTGQVLAVQVVGAGAVMNLLHSNGQAIDAAAYRTQRWTGQLPADDHYQIEVSGYGAYTLEVALSPATAQLASPEAGWIRFAPGETTTTVTGELAPGQVQRYLLTAQAQQLLVIQVLLGTIEVRTIAPNGQYLGKIPAGGVAQSGASSKSWQTRLPQAGDYMIELSTTQASRFAVKFEVY